MHESAKIISKIIDWKIPCSDSPKTWLDSCNVSVNILRYYGSSFASCNNSWSLYAEKCFRLLSINLGTYFSSDLRFADGLCFTGSSSVIKFASSFKKSPTLLPFDEAADDEVALLLDNSCSIINQSASTPTDKEVLPVQNHPLCELTSRSVQTKFSNSALGICHYYFWKVPWFFLKFLHVLF